MTPSNKRAVQLTKTMLRLKPFNQKMKIWKERSFWDDRQDEKRNASQYSEKYTHIRFRNDLENTSKNVATVEWVKKIQEVIDVP